MSFKKIVEQKEKTFIALFECEDCHKDFTEEYNLKHCKRMVVDNPFYKRYCRNCIKKRKKLRQNTIIKENWEKRKKTLESNCYFCGTKENLVLHHTQFNSDRYIALCGSCHRKLHLLIKTPLLKRENDILPK